jgi:DNA-binding LytR/AlgR family response regulator
VEVGVKQIFVNLGGLFDLQLMALNIHAFDASPPINYRDRWLIVLAVPLINILNYYLTYSSIVWGAHLVITFCIDTLEGYAAWYFARLLIIRFDRTLPWEDNFYKRSLIQFPIVCAAVLTVIISLTEIINFVATDHRVPTSFYTEDIFIYLIWAVFINVLYIALYFFYKYKERVSEQAKKAEPEAILIKTGRTQKRISLNSFSFFFVSNELVYGVTPDGKNPLPGYTLDRLDKMLKPEQFFRINRQIIITRSVVDFVKKEENGKLALYVKASIENPIMISRLRAPAFKKWLADQA